ncbi:MAG TPA: response regulator [Candidatus Acidoferrales bacterium]|nr:response regulator [Candidatus Acidoferrales bacterium]
MDQIIRETLAGKRFALMGFEQPEAESIIAALATVRGLGHVVGGTPSIPGLNSLSPFDACFINASAPAAGGEPAPMEMIARSRKPAVIVGSCDELTRNFHVAAEHNRDFAMRPLESEEVLLRAFRVLKYSDVAAEEAQPARREDARRVVVLADDDAATTMLISTILKHFNYECAVAHDGSEALDMVRQKKPDLVLLDISMPKMDGFEALRVLRSEPATKEIPVILVTAHHNEDELVKGFSLGADDYITKPFNSAELMARINRIMRKAEAA